MSIKVRGMIAAAAVAASVAGPTSAVADKFDDAIYRETFNIPDPAQGDTSPPNARAVAAALGWIGLRNGGSFNNPCSDAVQGESCLQAFGSGSTQRASVANPRVFRGSGNAFWSPQVIGVTIYTEETRPLLSVLRQARIIFETRHNQSNSLTRLAFRVGANWYISEQAVSHTAGPNTWQTHEFTNLGTASFGISPVVTDCNVPPCGPYKPTGFGQSLPASGRADAIGWFIDGTNANHRYDNYTIIGRRKP